MDRIIKYALIGDIHGNLEALRAVIADIDKQKVDRVICLGDTIFRGAHGHECLDIVKNYCDAVVVGNNDIKFAVSVGELANLKEDFDYEDFCWHQRQLTQEDINYIRNLPRCCEFNLSGNLVRCFHSSPDSLEKYINMYSSSEEKASLFYPSVYTTGAVADVVVYAHLHYQFMDKLFYRTLVNVGSVGSSFNFLSDPKHDNVDKTEVTNAHYVILSGYENKKDSDISIVFRSVPYDIDKELETFNYEKYRARYSSQLKDGKL